MALRYYKNKKTGEIKRSLKRLNTDTYVEVIKCPNGKFMICANKATGRSKIKDLKPALTERARNHHRENDLDETIQINKDNDFGVAQNLLNEKGQRRRKIDDL